MKLIAIIILILPSICVYSQEDWDWDDDEDLDKWYIYGIGFGCSFDGSATEPVERMSTLLKSSEYNKIRMNLDSKNPADRFLAVFVLEKLQENGDLILISEEQEKITRIKNENVKIGICSGCTDWEEEKINILLNAKLRHFMYQAAELWFLELYEKNK